MSQLDNTSPFSGISERFISRQDWAQFVQKVLEVTVVAIINPKPLPKVSTSDQRHLWALMRAQKLSKADHLKACNPNPFDGFVIYQSEHHRDFCGRDIRLYHLFFDFDVQTSTYETDN